MAINNINNSIGFPRLTNNTSGMFLTMPQLSANIQSPAQNSGLPASSMQQPAVLPQSGSQTLPVLRNKKEESQKYFIGAAAIAASAIAAIMLAKSGKTVQATAPEPLADCEPKFFAHTKDRFLEMIGRMQEPDLWNRHIKVLQKRVRVDANGKSILKKGEPVYANRGISVLDEVKAPAAIAQRTFVTDDGKELAKVIFDSDGNVWQYYIRDLDGNIIRDYNISEPGATTKIIYDKNGRVRVEAVFDGTGRSREIRYNEDGTVKNSAEFDDIQDEAVG